MTSSLRLRSSFDSAQDDVVRTDDVVPTDGVVRMDVAVRAE